MNLPRSDAPSPPHSTNKGEKLGRVLVVDDLDTNVQLLSFILKMEGLEVVTANSGPHALEKLQNELTRPDASVDVDVVLLDVMMPDMDGFEVCARIRQNSATATLPVVMVTALQDSSDRVRALEAGADDFLTKPVEATEVIARVRSLVRAKRDRDALEKAFRDLKAAEEMRDSLSAMLVHDLRTPLTTVLVSLDLLNNGMVGQLTSIQQEITDMCSRSGKHLLSLVNELLDISKLESGEMQLARKPVDVPALVKNAVTHIEGQAKDLDTSIIVEAAPDLPLLHADEELLSRVLINLLGNAMKFAHHKTPVRAFAEVRSQGNNDSVVVSIQDDGEGIDPSDQERIFSKFAQAENRRTQRGTSTGLGLTFCKLAVEAHGGRIWVESEVGHGSTFLISIPCSTTDTTSDSPN